jgi:hypothetical protein
MTNEEITIAVHEALGWIKLLEGPNHYGYKRGDEWHYLHQVPNYPESLDACAEFEATLTDHELMLMHHQITKILRQMKDPRPAWRAPAKVRCLAYLKTKGILP